MKLVPVKIEWIESKKPSPENPVTVYSDNQARHITSIGRDSVLFIRERDNVEVSITKSYATVYWQRPVETETRWVNYYCEDCSFEHDSEEEADAAAGSDRIACFSYEKEVE